MRELDAGAAAAAASAGGRVIAAAAALPFSVGILGRKDIYDARSRERRQVGGVAEGPGSARGACRCIMGRREVL